MADALTIEELSRATAEPEERLRRWRDLGILKAVGDRPPLEDIERVRLVQLFMRRGIGIETVGRWAQAGMLDRYVEMVLPGGDEPTYSLAEAAEITGLEPEMARKMWATMGFSENDRVRERDAEALRIIRTLLDVGFPAEALLEGGRVYVDALGRVAEMEARLFHIHVHERLRSGGMTGEELMRTVDEAGERAREPIDPMVLYFHRIGWERAVREDAVMHLLEEDGLMEPAEVPGQFTAAIVFIDLASFTPLAESMGDEKAAGVLHRFSLIVRESVARWEGRVVKQIGDAFMLVFLDARAALACALEIEERTAAERQFPAARAGVHWGKLLYREGDYVGSNVNVASRVASEAQRHQVLATAAVRRAAKELPEVEFVRLGKRRLKGLSVQVELFETRRVGAGGREKHIDPVCGMEMDPAEVSARLTLEGTEHSFCSDDCLRKYVADPAKYG